MPIKPMDFQFQYWPCYCVTREKDYNLSLMKWNANEHVTCYGLPKRSAVHSHEKLIAWICNENAHSSIEIAIFPAIVYEELLLIVYYLHFECILLFDKFDATESEMMLSMCTNYGTTNMKCLHCKLIKWNCIYCLHTKWLHMFHSSELSTEQS